jgi:hypothetical protein
MDERAGTFYYPGNNREGIVIFLSICGHYSTISLCRDTLFPRVSAIPLSAGDEEIFPAGTVAAESLPYQERDLIKLFFSGPASIRIVSLPDEYIL